MTEKQGQEHIDPGLYDTQRLLQGVETPPEGSFELDDILEEYGGAEQTPPVPPEAKEVPPPAEPLPARDPEPAPAPEEPPEPAPPSEAAAVPAPDAGPEETPPADELVLDDDFWDELFAITEEDAPVELEEEPTRPFLMKRRRGGEKSAAKKRPAADRTAPPPAAPPVPEPKPAPRPQPDVPPPAEEPEDISVSMEDVVASTVDAVKEQQARRQAQFLKHLEKVRKKTNKDAGKRRPERRPPPEEPEDEPPPGEAAGWHKRRYRECRRCLLAALPVLVLLWLPWVLSRMGVELPFFSVSADNAALCVLVPQAALSILCWPVFRAAVEGVMERAWTACAAAALTTLATLLDEMTLLLLPERSDAAPLGGVAAMLLVFSLWGLTGWHRGMAETMRTAAMGAPSRLVDATESGIAKGSGSLRGFRARTDMEDTSTQWQRLLLPMLAAASTVFAVLSSVGRGHGQDLLWCWSAILCASSSLVFPLVFFVPFGRLAVRLARNGAAVAGQYGAYMLSGDRRIVVTDSDLFPMGAAVLNGLKTYGEERERAISYAATLAIQGGGLLGRLFEDLCRSEDIPLEELEHFHVHDDSGLGGMIHGETVLVGSAAFMRHMAVRLPSVLPGKTPVCLAVDGQLTAVFAVKYSAADTVSAALSALRRNGLQLVLAVRDGNVSPKLLRARFGVDGGAVLPELSERLALSDPEREAAGPDGLLYRDGMLPFVSLVAGSRRLCQIARVGNLLSVLGSVSGVLLGFYLTFVGSYGVLSPILLATYLLLWVMPMLPLVWSVDKL